MATEQHKWYIQGRESMSISTFMCKSFLMKESRNEIATALLQYCGVDSEGLSWNTV